MNLQDLFDNNPIHFSDDDAYTLFEDNMFMGDQPLDKQEVSFDNAYSRPLGTFNGLDIWGSRYFGKNIDLYGILDNKKNILAWTAFDNKRHLGYSTFIRAWVRSNERGRDHTLSIINFLTSKAKEKIFMDKNEQTSASSRKMLKKWFGYTNSKRLFNIKVYNTDGIIKDPDLNDVLLSGKINDVYMIFENIFHKDIPRYGSGKRVLKDFIYY